MTVRPEYKIYASWGPREESPEVIAARYLACTDRLKQIHPAYDDWIFDFNGKPKKFDALRGTLAAAVAANVDRAESGKPTPIYGYWATVTNTMRKVHPRSLSLWVNAGAWLPSAYFCNSALIKTATRIVPEPSIIAYPAFKAALLALVESFDATYCSAYPQQIMDFWDPARHLRIGWMSYVAPRFAPLITPPPSAIYERTAQGGLLMSATQDTFSPSRRSPRHPQSPRALRGAALAARRRAGMRNT